MVMEAQEVDEVVIVAASNHPCSISALEWALYNIDSRSTLKLVHVVPKIDSISTPILIYSNENMDDLTSTHNIATCSKNVGEDKKEILQAHIEICYEKKVKAEIVLVEGFHVANSLVEHALSIRAKKVIIGQSNKTLSRILKWRRTSDIVNEKAAKFCSVCVISDGKPISIKGPGGSRNSTHIFDTDKNSRTVSASKTSSRLLSFQQTDSSYVSLLVKDKSLHQALKLDAVAKEAAQRKQPVVDEHVVRKELSAERLLREDEMQSCKDVGDEGCRSSEPMCEEFLSPRQQPQVIYRKYVFEEIRTATNDFAEENKIGKGGYGSVYRGKLDHTKVAIKVLEGGSFQGPKEFQQEVEFLGHMHHPHIILLLGACPERRCLVYEYLANGSLEDRLQCKDNTPPLPWYTRFRISAEIATALFFLHSLKPNPYVHRDVKPQNILLDSHFVSKLGDVGLTAFAPSNNSYEEIYHRVTIAVGTPPYMDPAYCMSGTFSPRSDVYGYGLVLLRMLTGRSPFKLQHLVEEALNEKKLKEILDPTAGDWPLQQATELAYIATRCTKFTPSDRTDLEVILPQLERLAMFADAWSKQGVNVVPKEFICPISEAVMKNPYVAADGFTYEHAEIQKWIQEHRRRSPSTNSKLEHTGLIPNHNLRMAIMEWQKRQSSM